MVCLFVGLVGGYLIRGSSAPETSPPAAAAPASSAAGEPTQSTASLNLEAQPLLDALRANPKDVPTLVKLGNVYYDHKAWSEAIGYYQQALDIRPGDLD